MRGSYDITDDVIMRGRKSSKLLFSSLIRGFTKSKTLHDEIFSVIKESHVIAGSNTTFCFQISRDVFAMFEGGIITLQKRAYCK